MDTAAGVPLSGSPKIKISINPRNAEEVFGSMAKQIAMLSKNIEMLRNG